MKPTGTVTFLFTDIEGSTKLAQDFPNTLQSALEKYHVIMHKAIESNNGFVFEIVGDAFCCAFENAEDAVKAAVDAQINLAKENWDDAVIKIRIGIHSGDAEWNGKRYMGYITLARASRVMSSGHGEQIIISNTTYELTKNKFYSIQEKDIAFRDLGERRMKDVIQPIRLFQILCPGLREEFPPLKTLDARPNNLPIQLTSFIGREAEMKQVKDLLKQTHLLTLTGSGGSGKTRLSMQVAADLIDDFANGVWFIELASLSEPSHLPEAIMKVFGLKEEPKRSLEHTLCDYLNDKEILIILDNCEHLVEQCATLAEMLLRNNHKLRIIATSREALRCSGEQTHRILSLDTPDPKEELSAEKLSQFEAVRLFIERALAVNSNFRINNDNAPALAQICFQLDGIPLAIELAAARIKVLSVEKIYERLNDRFKLLTGGKRTALPRQQTLQALIDWSYDLLPEEEKILWRRLSVFNEGWTLEASEEICSDEKIKKEEMLELLNQLTQKSVIIFDSEKERYRILESLKQYGVEKLKQAYDAEVVSSKHLHYFMDLSETAEPKLNGSEVQIWLEKLESEHGNLQSAIGWSISVGQREKSARLAGSLGNFWNIRGHYSTGRRLIESILENVQGISKSSLGKIYCNNGNLAMTQGEYEQAQYFLEKSLGLQREIGDKQGIAKSLKGLGSVTYYRGSYEQAQKFYEESLAFNREIGNNHGIAASLNNLGNITNILGSYEQAKKFYEESLTIFREIGDKSGITFPLHNLGRIAENRGNYEQAKKFYEESLTLNIGTGNKRGITTTLHHLGLIAYNQRNYEQAQKFYEKCLDLCRETGDKSGIASALFGFGIVAFSLGNHEHAQKFLLESLTLQREIGDKRGVAYSLATMGSFALTQENYDQAQKFIEESLDLNRELGDEWGISVSLIIFAGIISAGNHLSRSVILLGVVESALKSMRRVLEIDNQKLQEEIIKKLHEKLSEEEFSKYFEEGKKLTLEQAISMINEQ